MLTSAVHTLEHLLGTYLRDELEGIIDISPMGCRTGFYLIIWDEHETKEVAAALTKVLEKVVATEHIPAASAEECGNYREHSLFSTKEYAKIVLQSGLSDKPFERTVYAGEI